MNNDLLRIGAVAALAGAAAQLVAWTLDSELGGDPVKDVRIVAGNDFWTGGRLLHLIGIFLTVCALTLVGRTLDGGAGREWARVGQPLLVLMGALAASGIAAGAIMKDLASAWGDAGPETTHAYLATFDAARNTNETLVWCALFALGLYLMTLGVAILTGRVYARWIGWAAAASAALVLAGTLLELLSDAAFLGLLAGYVLYLAVLVALGVSMWRQAPGAPQPRAIEKAPLGAPLS